jgi:hypothetical protein
VHRLAPAARQTKRERPPHWLAGPAREGRQLWIRQYLSITKGFLFASALVRTVEGFRHITHTDPPRHLGTSCPTIAFFRHWEAVLCLRPCSGHAQNIIATGSCQPFAGQSLLHLAEARLIDLHDLSAFLPFVHVLHLVYEHLYYCARIVHRTLAATARHPGDWCGT